MILREYANESELARAAADYIIGAAREAVRAAGVFHIALSGGNTPRAVFRALADSTVFEPDMIGRTHLWWGDERSVPMAHADSNVGMAKQFLIDPIGFPPANVHAPNGGARDLDEEARRYEEELRRTLPADPAGRLAIDLVLLGIGADGHTASLFPGTKGLDVAGRYYIANEVPQLGTTRLTLTFDAILAARNILVLAVGQSKAAVLADVFRGKPAPIHPVERIRGADSIIIWMADKAATSRLDEGQRSRLLAGSAASNSNNVERHNA